MVRYRFVVTTVVTAMLLMGGCSATLQPPSWRLKELVEPVRRSVVTVVNYDVDGEPSSIGSGFFISGSGILVTNFHVLEGAYSAEIRMHDGQRYPVATVLAKNQLADLIKVRVDIPGSQVKPVTLAGEEPAIADRIFVVGSPMGLEQTVSEGIISAVRDIPAGGKILQLTAPISRGSSGGPVLNQDGEVVGVVSFQAATGQNLNFAISVNALENLADETPEPSIAEWTIRTSSRGPALAASLCSKGTRLTIQGEYEEALTFFKRAAEANPEDAATWYGLGSCYVGLGRPDDAIAAYQRPIQQDPNNAAAHFVLAMYYKAIEQFELEIPALREVLRIDPANLRARFELGRAYGAMQRTDEQIDTFKRLLDDRPDHVPTMLDLGTTLGSIGRFDEAMTLFAKARDLEPENELVYYNMGVTFTRMNQPEEAIRAYIHAIRNNPRMTAAHFNLGISYLAQDRRKLALDQYRILKSLGSDSATRLFDKIYP
ncbi:MAG: tetratricopeptide repeat protein [Desulfosarcina sp.]